MESIAMLKTINYNRNYYADLGVSRMASAKDIARAYREMSRLHHPDKEANYDQEKLSAIQEAYTILKSENSRQCYDEVSWYRYENFGYAAIRYHIKYMKDLLKHDFEINSGHENYGSSFLQLVIIYGREKTDPRKVTIEFLIRKGIDIDAVDAVNKTVLYDAININDIVSTIKLLSTGANTKMGMPLKASDEVNRFEKDQLKYTLKHNVFIIDAVRAIDNLLKQDHLVSQKAQLLRSKDCLEELEDIRYDNLNALCGKSDSFMDMIWDNLF